MNKRIFRRCVDCDLSCNARAEASMMSKVEVVGKSDLGLGAGNF